MWQLKESQSQPASAPQTLAVHLGHLANERPQLPPPGHGLQMHRPPCPCCPRPPRDEKEAVGDGAQSPPNGNTSHSAAEDAAAALRLPRPRPQCSLGLTCNAAETLDKQPQTDGGPSGLPWPWAGSVGHIGKTSERPQERESRRSEAAVLTQSANTCGKGRILHRRNPVGLSLQTNVLGVRPQRGRLQQVGQPLQPARRPAELQRTPDPACRCVAPHRMQTCETLNPLRCFTLRPFFCACFLGHRPSLSHLLLCARGSHRYSKD